MMGTARYKDPSNIFTSSPKKVTPRPQVLSYLLQYQASDSPWGSKTNRTVSSALSSATVAGLLPYTEYTIQVMSE